ncbi:MAG: hypothetical protein ACI4KO_04915 [Ruminiclostridium sp.]
MNLGKVEKIIIAVLVIGAIIGFGIFLFIVPSYNKIDQANKNYDNLVAEQQEVYGKLERENTIDNEIKEAKDAAKKLEGSFYPDLTTYEATEIALAYLKKCNLETNGITVTPLATKDIGLEAYEDVEVEYQLKTYSAGARGVDADALTEGQFKDGGKVYTVVYTGITDIAITDSEGNVIDKSKYTETMEKVYKKTLCRIAEANENKQTVAVLELSFDIKGKHKDYLEFLNYINDLDRASMLRDVVIPMTVSIEKDDEMSELLEEFQSFNDDAKKKTDMLCTDDTVIKEVPVNLVLFCVEPMEDLATLQAGDASIVVNQ